jgi:hypothetical protein
VFKWSILAGTAFDARVKMQRNKFNLALVFLSKILRSISSKNSAYQARAIR